ncbi:PREDICTED: glycerol-3-phosphate dehydrogenase [NAD(+)], cytoplasmic-like [Vollenhovia emeryi]|uniref:glycerol-3-phosphate dehydrogenase [NAD(+)], cytoplasmic-like n=1 Tax=Vollenhovia emeryi TaxID=411798 RepID=UPI0005F56CDA|nr:PREDICTED: glycerol-3-phosphate dehydrogenase [NAD(+)], cytoplasmic-like [Vollenhovia emeryi]XP_011869560.1 PREDICTED: glycerol-3-phosphate dehydrogenase [NAD(+)], cytoplasmic-like [Vollenhovia emeryi]
MPDAKKRVCIVGSGNWGSAIAKIVGANAMKYNNIFETRVTMYVYEEIINNEKLTSIINTIHENVKYLPGHKIPENMVAVPDVEAAKDADILIFVLPHQFIRTLCSTLLDNIKPTAVGLSLIKGFGRGEGNSIELISKIIEKNLRIQCNVLMGANLANEVAEEKFCETTIGAVSTACMTVVRTSCSTSCANLFNWNTNNNCFCTSFLYGLEL